MEISAHSDTSCRVIAYTCRKGFKVYSIDPWSEISRVELRGSVSNIVALTPEIVAASGSSNADSALSSRSVCVWKQCPESGDLVCAWQRNFDRPVVSIHGSTYAKNFAVVCQHAIYVFALSSFELLDELALGKPVSAVALNGPLSLLVYPSVDNAATLTCKTYRSAPEIRSFTINVSEPVSDIAVSNCGNYVAAASEDGTLIALYSVITCTKITTFRRGRTPQQVRSMCFYHAPDSHITYSDGLGNVGSGVPHGDSDEWLSLDRLHSRSEIPPPTFLCATSSTSTIHIFQIPGGAPLPAFLRTDVSSSVSSVEMHPPAASAHADEAWEMASDHEFAPATTPTFFDQMAAATAAGSGDALHVVMRTFAGVPAFATVKNLRPESADAVVLCTIAHRVQPEVSSEETEDFEHLDVVSRSMIQLPKASTMAARAPKEDDTMRMKAAYIVVSLSKAGYVFENELDVVDGGECRLLQQATLEV